ncbi:ATP-binding protein, partial [Stenotrophomonas sp. SrG]|uniref:ATP-binding protein n=1 Tax=Stenotrophomonas sp. SrG TaxID=3414430 RepID=UPI003CF38567
ESLTNAMRHAPLASLIEVRVTADALAAEVSVVNDGMPFSTPGAEPGAAGGYGIPGLHERVAHVGGTLTAGPGDGGRWV